MFQKAIRFASLFIGEWRRKSTAENARIFARRGFYTRMGDEIRGILPLLGRTRRRLAQLRQAELARGGLIPRRGVVEESSTA